MFVDASVIVAILNKEPGWEELLKQLSVFPGRSGFLRWFTSKQHRHWQGPAPARADPALKPFSMPAI